MFSTNVKKVSKIFDDFQVSKIFEVSKTFDDSSETIK